MTFSFWRRSGDRPARMALGHWAKQPAVSSVAATLIGLGLFGLGGWEPLERSVYNGFFGLRQTLQPSQWDDRIVVIAIDEASLATYGPFPWPRDRYADLLDKLMTVQPAAVGFDILMPEATPADARLADSLRFSGNAVLAAGGDGLGNAIQVTPTLIEPAQGAVRVGHVKHVPDSDGISRQAFLYERYGAEFAPSLAIALLETYQQSLTALITAETVETGTLNPDFLAEPDQFDQDHPSWINWPGPTRQIPQSPGAIPGLTTLSFQDVMAAEADAPLLIELQNKILLVGYTAVGVVGIAEDSLRTPFEPRVPTAGVYFHAALLDNLLGNRFLYRLGWPGSVGMIVLAALTSSWALRPLRLRGRLAYAVGMPLLWFGGAYGAFLAGVWVPVAAPVATGWLVLMAIQLTEQRERQALMDLLAINVSAEMAEFIWQRKDQLLSQGQIPGQELTATLLFADIRNFTTLSETLPSATLLQWLNRYFEVMTDCVMDHGGVVDKYIGDAIMAAFGAPLPRPGPEGTRQDALAAVAAAIAMTTRLEALNQEFAATGWPQVRFGIGIHTGTLVGGTVGSRHRANYSLFGDTVNVAARLQDMTKQLELPLPILFSATTCEQVRDRYAVVEKGQIQLRGKATTTTAYTLTPDMGLNPPAPAFPGRRAG